MTTDIETLIASLQQPECFPHEVTDFELIETHISVVLLTGEYAYKFKKPVNFGFLDFSTLEKRKFFCDEELRLNQITAPQIYLEVCPLYGAPDAPSFSGNGEVFEYCLKMKQYPQSALLSHIAQEAELTAEMIDKLAETVATFHQKISLNIPNDVYGTPDAVHEPSADNFTHSLSLVSDTTVKERLQRVQAWEAKTLKALSPLIAERRAAGFVRECHRDLHLGNIVVLNGEPVLFDAVEFNESFRWTDVVNDYGFLLMDLEQRDEGALASRFLNLYLEHTGDYAGVALIDYYKSYCAMIRAKVALITAEHLTSDAKAAEYEKFESYLSLAEDYMAPKQPKLIITHGLTGSGKTFATSQLLTHLNAVRIRSDVERHRLYSDTTAEVRYSAEANETVYQRLLTLSSELLASGQTVLVDACFLKDSEREAFAHLAGATQASFHILHCAAGESALKSRITARAEARTDASEATLDVLSMQQACYQPLLAHETSYTHNLNTEKCNWSQLARDLQD